MVRVSLGLENTEAEVDTVLQALAENAANKVGQATEQQLTKAEAKHQMNEFVQQRTKLVYG
jgi:hypothetical protein